MGHIWFKGTKRKRAGKGHADSNGKKVHGVKFINLKKIDCNTKTILKDKEGHFSVTKGSIQQEDIAIINIYVPNNIAPKYRKQKLTELQEEVNN